MMRPVQFTERPASLSTLGASALMIAVTVASFLLVSHFGAGLRAPHPPALPALPRASESQTDALPGVLLALLVVIIASRAVGAVFSYLRQPPVIGEVIAGILLGPSLLGRLAPEVFTAIFRPAALPFLGVLAQMGVVLFMFLVGMELDTGLVRSKTRAAIIISHASITVAFTLGSVLALWLYPRLATSDVPFLLFALFLGVAMAVTAFPVLVRILTDRGIQKTEVGALAISCAAVDDVTAWCLLAFISSVSLARPERAWAALGLTAGYIALVFAAVRPIVRGVVRRHEQSGRPTHGLLALMLIVMLTSALLTEWIGVHAVFGAFLVGAIVPHDSRLTREVAGKLQDFVSVLFLPAFFAFTGLRTELNLVHGAEQWTLCLAIIVVACLGKVGGTFAAALYSGLGWRKSAALGALMNTRGLMELIVLNVGLDRGIISPTLFSMLVVMAVVTTVATTPALDALARQESAHAQAMPPFAREGLAAARVDEGSRR